MQLEVGDVIEIFDTGNNLVEPGIAIVLKSTLDTITNHFSVFKYVNGDFEPFYCFALPYEKGIWKKIS